MRVPPHEEAILYSLNRYHLLTVDQVTRLHYSPGSSHYVNAVLKSMVEKKLLFRPERESINTPYVYMLGSRGVRYLRELGVISEAGKAFHPSEHTHISRLHLAHLLTVNEVLIACAHLPTVCPEYQLVEMKHDLTLKKELTGVVPDGWVDFRHQQEQVCFWWEIDRGTMEQKVFRKKTHALLDFALSEYHRVFGTQSLTILFATSAGERRVENMREWCEKELQDMHRVQDAPLFWFAPIPIGKLDPQWLFFSSLWRHLFRDEYTSLFDPCS